MMIDIDNLILHLLPPHKRQFARFNLLRSLIDLHGVYESFCLWVKVQRKMVNLTSQVKVLEEYLREQFKQPNISISEGDDQYLKVGLENEGDLYIIPCGINQSEPPDASVPLRGENMNDFSDVDFVCYAPSVVPRLQLLAEIEKRKLASKSFKIVEI